MKRYKVYEIVATTHVVEVEAMNKAHAVKVAHEDDRYFTKWQSMEDSSAVKTYSERIKDS